MTNEATKKAPDNMIPGHIGGSGRDYAPAATQVTIIKTRNGFYLSNDVGQAYVVLYEWEVADVVKKLMPFPDPWQDDYEPLDTGE